MVEALLAVITVLVIALCVLVGVTIYLHGSKSSLEDDKEELYRTYKTYINSGLLYDSILEFYLRKAFTAGILNDFLLND